MPMPQQGGQVIPAPYAAQGYGLALAGAATKSGAAGGLTTSQKELSFDANVFLSGDGNDDKVPVLIQLRARTGTLTLALGDSAAAEIHAINTWTDPIPCSALWAGTQSWWVTGSTTDVLEYRIYTV